MNSKVPHSILRLDIFGSVDVKLLKPLSASSLINYMFGEMFSFRVIEYLQLPHNKKYFNFLVIYFISLHAYKYVYSLYEKNKETWYIFKDTSIMALK